MAPNLGNAGQRQNFYQLTIVLLVCAAWLACSCGIILANRVVMVELDFHYPMALSCLGQAVTGIVAWFICDVLKAVPAVEPPISTSFYIKCIAPVGAAQGVGMWLSNTSYLFLTVAFIEMARSTLPLFTMLALFAAGLETPTNDVVKAVVLTGIGCAVAAYGEVKLSMVGLLAIGGNFMTEAGRLVMLQFLLQGCEFHAWQGLKLISLPSVLTLAFMSAVVEYKDMVANHAGAIVAANWYIFLAAASLGLAVNFCSNLIIKLSSATTLKVLAAVRGPIIVMSGVLLFAEKVTALQFVGYSIALAGFVWYNMAKANQAAAAKKSLLPQSAPHK